METLNRTARIAGLLYLAMGLPAVFSYQYVHHKLMVHGDASATARNILQAENLYRTGILAELVSALALSFLVWALYQLLHEVDRRYAGPMVMLVLLSVPISFANVLNELAALELLHGSRSLVGFDQPQREAMAMLFLNLHMGGVNLALLFWGLWLFPFGVLVMRCGFLPRVLGVLLIAGCFGWVLDVVVWLLAPPYSGTVNMVASAIGALSEGPISLWLLLRGVPERRSRPNRRVAAPSVSS